MAAKFLAFAHKHWIAAWLILLTGCAIVVMAERSWLIYDNVPFPVLTPIVKPGEAVHLRVRRCSSESITRTYVVTHSLIRADGRTLILPATLVQIDPGCTDEVSTVNVIPVGTAPGRYVIRGFGETTGFRTHAVPWSSAPFEVVL